MENHAIRIGCLVLNAVILKTLLYSLPVSRHDGGDLPRDAVICRNPAAVNAATDFLPATAPVCPP